MKKVTKKINIRIGIVAGQFNDFITKRLLVACLDTLKQRGVAANAVTTVWVPGAFELPVVAQKIAKKKNIDAVICLGAIVRGETYHFDIVANESARGIMNVALQVGKPVINGILACDTINQAYKRAEPKAGDNKGRDAANNAIDMIYLFRSI